jgi:hypothetical protein
MFGAPSQLVRGALAAAQDEVRHARLCLSLAARHLGADVVPEPLPAVRARPDVDLETLARECWYDGCLGEGAAAEFAAVRARGAREPAVRRTSTSSHETKCGTPSSAGRFCVGPELARPDRCRKAIQPRSPRPCRAGLIEATCLRVTGCSHRLSSRTSRQASAARRCEGWPAASADLRSDIRPRPIHVPELVGHRGSFQRRAAGVPSSTLDGSEHHDLADVDTIALELLRE